MKDFLTWFVEWIDALVARYAPETRQNEPGQQPVATSTPTLPKPVEAPVASKYPPMIVTWAAAIKMQEGGKPGDLNVRLNNPGNIKYTAFSASLAPGCTKGPQATDGGYFCKWDTPEHGQDALCQFLVYAAQDQLRDYHKDRTLLAFTMKYANIPSTHPYPRRVAAALGVPVTRNISTFL